MDLFHFEKFFTFNESTDTENGCRICHVIVKTKTTWKRANCWSSGKKPAYFSRQSGNDFLEVTWTERTKLYETIRSLVNRSQRLVAREPSRLGITRSTVHGTLVLCEWGECGIENQYLLWQHNKRAPTWPTVYTSTSTRDNKSTFVPFVRIGSHCSSSRPFTLSPNARFNLSSLSLTACIAFAELSFKFLALSSKVNNIQMYSMQFLQYSPELVSLLHWSHTVQLCGDL